MLHSKLPVTFPYLFIFTILAALCAMILMYINKLVGRLFGGFSGVYTFFVFLFAVMIILRRSSSYFFSGKMKSYTSVIIAFIVFLVTLTFNDYLYARNDTSTHWTEAIDFIQTPIFSLALAVIYYVVFYLLYGFLKKMST